MLYGQTLSTERFRLALLICLHIVMCCVSLIYLSNNVNWVVVDPATFHLFFDPARLHFAVPVVAGFAVVSSLFVIARFSFGYLVGFYLYMMIVGYLWLGCFTDLNYDHLSAAISAAASALTFLLAALFMPLPLPRARTLSPRVFDHLLTFILLLAVTTIALSATYNFRFVGLTEIYNFRDTLELPKLLGYLVMIVSNALLPFAFAGLVVRRAYWRAGVALVLAPLFYPITLSKLPLFAPFWLVAMLLFSKFFSGRTAVVLSLLVPTSVGVALHLVYKIPSAMYFSVVNFRMFAIPSDAMDVYYDYFSRHGPTWFCQISIVKWIASCAPNEPLWQTMEKTYKLGNLNASLLATEGLASVGIWWAPVSTFFCGLVIAFGNSTSDGLPSPFILMSGAMLAVVFLNVPLSIVMVTYGAGILFVLWYITPRTIFEADDQPNLLQARR